LNTKNRVTRLLAINFGGLGDEVLFLPTLQSVRDAHPEWHITLLTEPRGRSICDVTNLIDDNLVFDIKKKPLKPADYLTLLGLLRNGGFDIVLSSGSSPNVAALLFLSGIKQRIGFAGNRLAKVLLTNPVPLNRKQHATLMYHDLVNGLDIHDSARRPVVIVNDKNVQTMRAMIANPVAKRRVLLHPGMSRLALEKGIIKTWAPENWAGLAQKLLALGDTQVILAGGPDDEATIHDIMRTLGDDHPMLFSAYGKTASLKDLVALMDISDVIVCVDSAPMHLAVGLHKRLVALFGPTDPAKLLWPDERFIAIRDAEMAAKMGDIDPFLNAKRSEVSQPQQPYVQIPLDTVFQRTMDQLEAIASQGSSAESRHQ
jgi:ADP-heptose:LPS heptosyltransferase